MPFVVDASISATWLLPDEAHNVADRAYAMLDEDDAIVPGIWWFELLNILVVNERRGRLDADQVGRALTLLSRLPIRQETVSDRSVLLALARRHRLTAYDAAYLELAKREGVPLATLDAALARAAAAESVPLIGPAG
ncbi:MAG: type II toxin-antitoxin system VapC family toxin [Alphaproteobacteria bacterium]